jgi:PPOX class probable F420-dependent enzyme
MIFVNTVLIGAELYPLASPNLRRMARTIATNTTVDRSELVEFLRPRHRVILLTPRSDGGWQGSPVTSGVDAAGRIVISTYPERAISTYPERVKAANVARHGRAAVLALSDDFNGPWVQVEGPAELLTLPAAVEPLVDYYRSIAGEHPDWDEYRSAMTTQGKALIRITPDRWGPIATGGFPARLA